MLFNYQSSCIAHQATCLFYQMSKCLSTTFLIFLISYFQTAYESVLFRVILADSLYIIPSLPTEATEMFHILKNAENPHFYGFRLHTFRTTDKVVRYGINNQFDFAEHPAVIQRGEKRTINICVAVPDVA